MDTLSDVFHHLRSSGALVGRTLADPPWSTRFEEHASLTLVTPLRGSAWIRENNASYPLRTRDIAVVVGPDPFDVSSDPELVISPLFIQTEDGICRDSQGSSIEDIALGIRTCGTQLGANDALLTGSFTVDGRIADRLLESLPRVLVVPESARRTTALDLLETEILRDEPGQQAILDRLLDLVLVQALRDWFALPTTEAPGWYRASSDPIVGPALAAMHSFPHRSWTVQQLAEESRVSRATLARRFTELLGSPPMSYLNGWRLCLAADLLERSDATVESIAHSVGYGSAFSFSTAFHREYGVRPSAYRT